MFCTREKRAIKRAFSRINWSSNHSKEAIRKNLSDEQFRGGSDLTILTDQLYKLRTEIDPKNREFVLDAICDGVILDSIVIIAPAIDSRKLVKQELKSLKIKIKDCYFGYPSSAIFGIGFKNHDDVITFRLGQDIVNIEKILNVSNIWE